MDCLVSGACGPGGVRPRREVRAHCTGTSAQGWGENKSLYEEQFIGQGLGKEPRLYLGACSFIPCSEFYHYSEIVFFTVPMLTSRNKELYMGQKER